MNVGLGVGLNKTEKKIVALLLENPDYIAGQLANEVKATRRTIKRSTTSLLAKKNYRENWHKTGWTLDCHKIIVLVNC